MLNTLIHRGGTAEFIFELPIETVLLKLELRLRFLTLQKKKGHSDTTIMGESYEPSVQQKTCRDRPISGIEWW